MTNGVASKLRLMCLSVVPFVCLADSQMILRHSQKYTHIWQLAGDNF